MIKYKKQIIIVVILIGIVLSSKFLYNGVTTYAKYISESIWDYFLKSKEFYFESDYLNFEGQDNVNNIWDGNSVKFSVRNNLNQKLITDYDITYEVKCEVIGDESLHTSCKLNGTDSDQLNGTLSKIEICKNKTNDEVDTSKFEKSDCELGGYEWEKQVSLNEIYVDVVLTDENYKLEDITIKITATSTEPYKKVIVGNFILHKPQDIEGRLIPDIKIYELYSILTITNTFEDTKCMKLSWNPDKMVIDLNSESYSSYSKNENDYINEIKFNLTSGKSKSYIFYKKDKEEEYSIEDFLIEETVTCE